MPATYSFIGLTNPQIINLIGTHDPPSPDNFDQNDYWNTMVALKKSTLLINRQVVPKELGHGTTFDMYRHDYSRSNTAKVSGATNLYSSLCH